MSLQVTVPDYKRPIPDIQNTPDRRNIAINKVGIKNVRYPITLPMRDGGVQHTVADVNMYVALPEQFKGTHMSRFVALLNEFKRDLHVDQLDDLLKRMQERLKAESAYFEVRFTYFIEKAAPVSGEKGMVDYRGAFFAERNGHGNAEVQIEVTAPVTTLCPCSKEISDRGAHNQRSEVTVRVRAANETVWIEDLVEIIERNSSCPIFSMLKRPDEKWVTEQAYDNPKFVEDVVRDITLELMADPRIGSFSVESENYESIHNHNAYALIECDMAQL